MYKSIEITKNYLLLGLSLLLSCFLLLSFSTCGGGGGGDGTTTGPDPPEVLDVVFERDTFTVGEGGGCVDTMIDIECFDEGMDIVNCYFDNINRTAIVIPITQTVENEWVNLQHCLYTGSRPGQSYDFWCVDSYGDRSNIITVRTTIQ
jgi:hypothetical protein